MRVRKFNMVINCYCFMKNTNLYSKQHNEIWTDKSWAINFFPLKQGVVHQQLAVLGQWSCDLVWRMSGREGTDGWSVQWVRHRGLAQAFGVRPWRGMEKWEDKSWRRLSGCISFNASGSVVCVTSLLAKSFVTIISFWLFFFPSQRWWWSWTAQVSAGVPAFRCSLPFASL